jgi:D-alanyl-D-alanine carboxypeptidase/D-alanyl-D-alanine-endopeptidase (penicillin-binding protein 4)
LEEKMPLRIPAHLVPFLVFTALVFPALAPAADSPARSRLNVKGAELAETIRSLVEKRSTASFQVGVAVIDNEGKLRAAVDGDRPLSPASNQKILVVGAALGTLGPEFRYETRLAASAPPRGGEVGDLVVVGDGDPNISGRFHNGDPTAVFRNWAAELKKAGLRRVSGNLVVDDSRFDSQRVGPGWKESQAGSPDYAEVGALNLNDNCIEITVRPTQPGKPVKAELSPPTAYVSIDNQCKTASAGREQPILHRKPGTNSIVIRKEIGPTRKGFPSRVALQDPGLYAGTVLAEVLKAEGIEITGTVVRGTLKEKAGASPAILLRHSSSLAEDLRVINKTSTNLHADILLKALGAQAEGLGSMASGGRAVAAFLSKAKLAAEGLKVDDGSGLSAGNRVSAGTLAALLSWIQRQPYFQKYQESLPIAGADGTLKNRFQSRKSKGHVFAKTGYIAGVSALSGYVNRGGKHWVFSVLVNGLRTGGSRSEDIAAARTMQEEIAEAVYQAMPE